MILLSISILYMSSIGTSKSLQTDPLFATNITQPIDAASRGILSLPGCVPRSRYIFELEYNFLSSDLFKFSKAIKL